MEFTWKVSILANDAIERIHQVTLEICASHDATSITLHKILYPLGASGSIRLRTAQVYNSPSV